MSPRSPSRQTRRGVAQLGSALALGAGGRGFKSRHPDRHTTIADSFKEYALKSTVETLSPTRVRLTIEVPFDELEADCEGVPRDRRAGPDPRLPSGQGPGRRHRPAGRSGAVLNEAVRRRSRQILAAVREHEVKTLGRPEVEITEFADGEPLKFTAEVDVRPEITIPDLDGVGHRDASRSTDDEVDEQLRRLRERFATLKTSTARPQDGDYVQLDLRPPSTAKRCPAARRPTLPRGRQPAAPGPRRGPGRPVRRRDAALHHPARRRRLRRPRRRGGGHRPAVKESELPELDDEFAQLASEFDTLDELRDDLRERLAGSRGRADRADRDKALEQLVEAAEMPAPEGVVKDEVDAPANGDPWPRPPRGRAPRGLPGPGGEDRGADRRGATEAAAEGVRSSCCSTPSPTPRTSRSPTTSSPRGSSTGAAARPSRSSTTTSWCSRPGGRGVRRRPPRQGARLGDGSGTNEGHRGQHARRRRASGPAEDEHAGHNHG